MHSRATDRRSASQMPGKMARSTPRPPFGPPVVRVAARSSRLVSREARKLLLFTPVRASSGECRLKRMRTSSKSKREVKRRTPPTAVTSKMTTLDAVKLLRSGARGVAEWNAWRRKFGSGGPPVKLCGVRLDEAWLEKVAFYGVDLTGASLKG